jgi:hypothetical protein
VSGNSIRVTVQLLVGELSQWGTNRNTIRIALHLPLESFDNRLLNIYILKGHKVLRRWKQDLRRSG